MDPDRRRRSFPARRRRRCQAVQEHGRRRGLTASGWLARAAVRGAGPSRQGPLQSPPIGQSGSHSATTRTVEGRRAQRTDVTHLARAQVVAVCETSAEMRLGNQSCGLQIQPGWADWPAGPPPPPLPFPSPCCSSCCSPSPSFVYLAVSWTPAMPLKPVAPTRPENSL